MTLTILAIFLISYFPLSFGEVAKDDLQSKEYIETHLIPYISEILNSDHFDQLHKDLKKDGCAEKLIQKFEKEFDAAKPIKCKKSKSPLFNNKDDFDMLKITIVSEFDKFNKKKSTSTHPAVARIINGETEEIVPIQVSHRGNSRSKACEWRPQRWNFYNKETLKRFSSKIANLERDESDTVFLSNLLKTIDSPDTKGSTSKESIFGRIGDDIKLVTHCGHAPGYSALSGKTHEEQKERVLKEFLVYQMFDEMKSTVIKTRLVDITYVSPTGKVLKKSIGFLREPRGSMAKRCRLNNFFDEKNKSENKASAIQVNLLNHFAYSMDYRLEDGHNIHILTNDKGERVYGPYDYDLSGIFASRFYANRGGIEKGAIKFEKYLKTLDGNPIGIVQVYALRRKLDKMLKLIEQSPLLHQSKYDFRKWMSLYSEKINSYILRNSEDYPDLVNSLITRDISKKSEG